MLDLDSGDDAEDIALDAGCDKPDSFIVYSQGEVVETLQDHSLWIQDSSGNTQPDVATFKMEGQELAAKHGVAGVVTVDVNDKAGDVDVNGKAGDVTAQPGTVCCAVSPHLRAAGPPVSIKHTHAHAHTCACA